MNLNKIGKVFTSKYVGTGPSSYEKRIYRAAVPQRLRNTGLYDLKHNRFISTFTSIYIVLYMLKNSTKAKYYCLSQFGISAVVRIKPGDLTSIYRSISSASVFEIMKHISYHTCKVEMNIQIRPELFLVPPPDVRRFSLSQSHSPAFPLAMRRAVPPVLSPHTHTHPRATVHEPSQNRSQETSTTEVMMDEFRLGLSGKHSLIVSYSHIIVNNQLDAQFFIYLMHLSIILVINQLDAQNLVL